MDNFYTSDWHIHSEWSYDAELKLDELLERTEKLGITEFGISDHVNYPFMIEHLKRARKDFLLHKKDGFHFGVELGTLPKYQLDFAIKNKDKVDVDNPKTYMYGCTPDIFHLTDVALPLTQEELAEYGVEYVIGGAHWSFGIPFSKKTIIKDYQRQQLFLATDERIDIIAHPWWIYVARNTNKETISYPWYDDFSIIPKSMHDEFTSAAKENGKMVEMNLDFIYNNGYTDKFKNQYCEYIRSIFEQGVPITIGSDLHSDYRTFQEIAVKYLTAVGFKKEDFSNPKFRTTK